MSALLFGTAAAGTAADDTEPNNLWTAAADGDLRRVDDAISNGEARADEKDPNGYTAL